MGKNDLYLLSMEQVYMKHYNFSCTISIIFLFANCAACRPESMYTGIVEIGAGGGDSEARLYESKCTILALHETHNIRIL